MLRFMSVCLAVALPMAAAEAAPVAIVNGDFEATLTLERQDPVLGDFGFSATGWSTGGAMRAGTFEPNLEGNAVYLDAPSEIGGRVGFAVAGSSLYQLLDEIIAPDTDYELTALFGDRVTQTAGGSFGFFAGDPANIIASQAVVFPGEGQWSEQSLFVSSLMLADFIGQQLGVIFLGGGTQLNFDNVRVEAYRQEVQSFFAASFSEPTSEVPLPGAGILFATAAFGGFVSRRRRAAATA